MIKCDYVQDMIHKIKNTPIGGNLQFQTFKYYIKLGKCFKKYTS